MKPLELVNYGPFKEGPNGSHIFHGPRKRLTDAELAAEYNSMMPSAAWGRGYLTVLERFATRPHYDEADQ